MSLLSDDTKHGTSFDNIPDPLECKTCMTLTAIFGQDNWMDKLSLDG